MQKLLDFLSRLGSTELSKLIGRETISIFNYFDSIHVASYKLAEPVVSQFGPEGLLLVRQSRKLLLGSLGEIDARRLCRLLGITEGTDPWANMEINAWDKRKRLLENVRMDWGRAALNLSQAGND